MTFEELAKQAATITDERVKAESPSIRDTPRRRYSVFQSELTVLLTQNNVPVDVEAVQKAGEAYAFGPKTPSVDAQEPAVEAPKEPEKPAKATKSEKE